MGTPLRVPTIPGLEPDAGGEWSVLSDRWGMVRERLCGAFPPDADDPRLGIIHPVFGSLSCRQMGSFLVAHLHHHPKHWPGNAS